MKKSKIAAPSEVPAVSNYDRPWVTDGAWICGLAGVIAILGLGYLFGTTKPNLQGMSFLGVAAPDSRLGITLLGLALTSLVMVVVELLRLWRFEHYDFTRTAPLVQKRQWAPFLKECVLHYLWLLLLFFICRYAYHLINEYGYRSRNPYYQPWFYTLDVLWRLYIVGGLPYIILTRAFKYNPEADAKDYAALTKKMVYRILSAIPGLQQLKSEFNVNDKRSALGLVVKFFFAPVMTVFFYDNFGHLQNNMDYLFNTALPNAFSGRYNIANFGNDIHNILTSVIFTIDVGLAWVGYVITSRWVDNQTISAEPTILGWVVCLMSYPPFRIIGGWLVVSPGDNLYQQIPNEFIVSLFGGLMILSFFLYMLPTVWFGIRFSNLTHRGIIRKGPFAVVRHPAYATKNLAWWLVGFPTVVYVGYSRDVTMALFYFVGLIFLTFIYYLRAITEERHLSMDPDYVEYCKHVKYRFIPGVI